MKGVFLNRDKFRAHIKLNGKRIYLGSHTTIEAAKAARDAAVKQHHGEFARLN